MIETTRLGTTQCRVLLVTGGVFLKLCLFIYLKHGPGAVCNWARLDRNNNNNNNITGLGLNYMAY